MEKAILCNDLEILKATWVAAYWLGNEFKDVHQWGFPSVCSRCATGAGRVDGRRGEGIRGSTAGHIFDLGKGRDTIKRRRGGVYPPDWYAKVINNKDKFNVGEIRVGPI